MILFQNYFDIVVRKNSVSSSTLRVSQQQKEAKLNNCASISIDRYDTDNTGKIKKCNKNFITWIFVPYFHVL